MKIIHLTLIAFSILVSCSSSSEMQDSSSKEKVDDGLIAMVKKGGKFGFINTNNETIIPFEYDQATTFSEGLACVKKGQKWMFINVNNEVIIDNLTIEYPTRFSSGLARLHMGFGNMRFVNKQGKTSDKNFSSLYEFHHGLARATSADKTYRGYIDKSGEMVIKYTKGLPADEGDFIAPITSYQTESTKYFDKYQPSNPMLLYGFMDLSGNPVGEVKYRYVGSFSNGLCKVSTRDLAPRWGFIDTLGNEVIPFNYKDARDFSDGAAAVKGKEWMVIDKEGNVLFEHPFAHTIRFSEGLASFWSEGQPKKKGYINKKGSFEIEPQFDEAFEFKNGFALVILNGKIGCINKRGEIVIEPQYERADNFVNPDETNELLQEG